MNIFRLETDIGKLQLQMIGFFDKWEKEVALAAPLFNIEGAKLEHLARTIPQHQFHYATLAQEAKAAMKYFETMLEQQEAMYAKNYAHGNRAYGAREVQQFIQGEKEVVEMKQLIVQAAYYHQQLAEIVESIKQMGWMVGHIVKLRVATLEETVV
jgi:hypothetical protein